MSIRAPRKGEERYFASNVVIVEYFGGSANLLANLPSSSLTEGARLFHISLPLFVAQDGLLNFYLDEAWHTYLGQHMPMCVVSSDGICSKRPENTGPRTTSCCDFYNYFSARNDSSKKETLLHKLVSSGIRVHRESGFLDRLKDWSQRARLRLRRALRA